MRLLVTGGRDYTNRTTMLIVLGHLMPEVVIHGAARGADTLCDEVAKVLEIERMSFPADWDTFGRGAGSIRNSLMLKEAHPSLVLAFPGGKGTEDMVARAKKAGLVVLRVEEP